ncbi:MAG TPA: hypothetical protein VM677_33185 [Actinokineospora sp.]|jgi:hypothetical protein|nr:hypothetical protein [Actinokineospora sp.]
MTPTPPEDTVFGSTGPRAQAAAVIPMTPRLGGCRARRRARRPARQARPATVWQCGGDDPRDGTAVLSGWLLNAIVKIVTGYSRPGDRVLLLAPPPIPSGPLRWTRVGRGTGPYDGLHEAAWTVARLGRGIQTWTARPPHTDVDFHPASDPADEPAHPADRRSASGPRADHSRQPARPELTADSSTEPLPLRAVGDRFDVVITTVAIDHPYWTRDIDWDALLTPRGITAIITHSDSRGTRCTHPTSTLVSTLSDCGLGWLDHVILLETLPDPDHQPAASGTGHRRAHHDLLLFARPARDGAQVKEDDDA